MLQQIPNVITILRILLIAPLCWFLWEKAYQTALLLLLVAGASDALDGFLARRYHWFTPLGAFLDPIADKLFVVSMYVVFGSQHHIPVWLVALVFARDVMIMVGAMAYRLHTGYLEMRPLVVSKINTALQIALLGLILFHVALYSVPLWVLTGLYWAVALSTIVSGAAYVWIWSRYALQKGNE